MITITSIDVNGVLLDALIVKFDRILHLKDKSLNLRSKEIITKIFIGYLYTCQLIVEEINYIKILQMK